MTTTLLTRRGARGLEAFMPPPLFEKRVEVHFSMARQAGDSVVGDLWQCCSERTVFRVRSGPDYKRNGFKEPSGDTFFECVGVDVFRLSKKVRVLFLLSSSLSLCLSSPESHLVPRSSQPQHTHVCQYIKLPDLPDSEQGAVNGVPPFIVINCMLPGQVSRSHPQRIA
jgi:hypothetical protein